VAGTAIDDRNSIVLCHLKHSFLKLNPIAAIELPRMSVLTNLNLKSFSNSFSSLVWKRDKPDVLRKAVLNL
jgi:hypothetical protein